MVGRKALNSVLIQHDVHFGSDIQRGQESLVEASSTNNVYGMFAVTAGAHCEQAQSGRVLKLLQFQERGLLSWTATRSGTLDPDIQTSPATVLKTQSFRVNRAIRESLVGGFPRGNARASKYSAESAEVPLSAAAIRFTVSEAAIFSTRLVTSSPAG